MINNSIFLYYGVLMPYSNPETWICNLKKKISSEKRTQGKCLIGTPIHVSLTGSLQLSL